MSLKKLLETLMIISLLEKEDNVNLDKTEKHQGDVVKLVKPAFALYLHKVETEQPLFPGEMNDERFEAEVEPMKDEKFVVVSKADVHYEFNCGHCDHLHVADLVIASLKTREEYYIFYDTVKIVEGDN